jgi:hypothetical protein
MTKGKTPPEGGPPGQRPPTGDKAMFSLVKAPDVEKELRNIVEALENQKPPAGGGNEELISAIESVAMALRDSAEATQGNTAAIEGQTKATHTLTLGVENLCSSVDSLATAVNRIADILTTPAPAGRATHVTISSVLVEPLARQGGDSMADFDTVTHPPIVCVPIQCRPEQEGFGGTVRFNGAPLVFPVDGSTGEATADPKREDPDVPGEWLVDFHVKPPSPMQESMYGMYVGISVNATVDKPETTDTTEKFVQVFEKVAQWIAPTEEKATHVSLSAHAEPL